MTALAKAKKLPPPGWTPIKGGVDSVFNPTTSADVLRKGMIFFKVVVILRNEVVLTEHEALGNSTRLELLFKSILYTKMDYALTQDSRYM